MRGDRESCNIKVYFLFPKHSNSTSPANTVNKKTTLKAQADSQYLHLSSQALRFDKNQNLGSFSPH
ncbi:hypothetical protein LguiA_007019 [Lonicera macranthoides]